LCRPGYDHPLQVFAGARSEVAIPALRWRFSEREALWGTRDAGISAKGPGCVKTCASRECAELSSPSSSLDGDCQYCSFPIQCNRDELSTRKFDAGVFTHLGHLSRFADVLITSALPLIADLLRKDRHVRFVPKNEPASREGLAALSGDYVYRSQLSHHAARNSADFTLRLSSGRLHDASTNEILGQNPNSKKPSKTKRFQGLDVWLRG
jgi:hypothetical protein